MGSIYLPISKYEKQEAGTSVAAPNIERPIRKSCSVISAKMSLKNPPFGCRCTVVSPPSGATPEVLDPNNITISDSALEARPEATRAFASAAHANPNWEREMIWMYA